MDTNTHGILAANTLRLAHDFKATFAIDPAYAIAHLRVSLEGMEEQEVRQWFDYLGELLVEEESTVDIWLTLSSLCAVSDYRH
jgi:hypothetical protein